MRERCLQHGLAVGPDGTCVLCRSRRAERRKPHPELLIVALLAIAAGLVVWRTTRSAVNRGASRAESASAESESSASAAAPLLVSSTAVSNTEEPTGHVERHVLVERDRRGLASELRARGETDVSGEYFAGRETYELLLPATSLARMPHGMIVWISSDPSGAIPNPEWRRVLAAHRFSTFGKSTSNTIEPRSLKIICISRCSA